MGTYTINIKPYSINQYRNAHFRKLHKLKTESSESIAWQLKAQNIKPAKKPVAIIYEFSWKINRRRDLDNYVVTAKFINDVLKPFHVKQNPYGLGIIPDDSIQYVRSLSFRPSSRNDDSVTLIIHEI